MGKGHKPLAGSRGYWPKKRAPRIYASITSHPIVKEAVPLDFAGYKAGMTSVIVSDGRKASVTHGQEIVKPATIIDCPSLSVNAIRLYKKTPYGMHTLDDIWAEKVSKDLARKTELPEKTDTKKKLEETEKNLEKISDIRLMVHTKPRDSGIGKKTPEMFVIVAIFLAAIYYSLVFRLHPAIPIVLIIALFIIVVFATFFVDSVFYESQ